MPSWLADLSDWAPITLEALNKAAQQFSPIGGPDAWPRGCRVGRRIMNGEAVSPDEFGNEFVTGYLNAWRSRFPHSEARGLLDAMMECRDDILVLPAHLVEIEVTHLPRVALAFERIAAVPRAASTTPSKVLSTMAPAALVIWDQPIADHYGFAKNAAGYARFLWCMRNTARRLCQDSVGRCDRVGTTELERLATPPERGKPLPLAKLLDEWNWMSITLNKNR